MKYEGKSKAQVKSYTNLSSHIHFQRIEEYQNHESQ